YLMRIKEEISIGGPCGIPRGSSIFLMPKPANFGLDKTFFHKLRDEPPNVFLSPPFLSGRSSAFTYPFCLPSTLLLPACSKRKEGLEFSVSKFYRRKILLIIDNYQCFSPSLCLTL